MATDEQRRLIIILSAILLAVVVVSGAVLPLLPSDNSPTPEDSAITDNPTGPNAAVPNTFQVQVLDRAAYKSLNIGVLNSLIPVRPPVTAGKANPFL